MLYFHRIDSQYLYLNCCLINPVIFNSCALNSNLVNSIKNINNRLASGTLTIKWEKMHQISGDYVFISDLSKFL